MAQEKPARVLIVGAGQAGGEAAVRLRAGGFAGEITLIGAEPIAPYQRPPLSKAYLSGAIGIEGLLLRPAHSYADEGITLLSGRRAVWIDRTSKRLRLDGGQELAYDTLILAMGAAPRRLAIPGMDLPGVFTLRTAADVDAIRAALQPGMRMAIIGAGYIGLETAAVARKLGIEVTVIEAAARPLARVTSPEIAGFFLDRHTAEGVRFALSAQAGVIQGTDRARGVALTDGESAPADLVIVGAGVVPDVGLAERAQIACADGVIVDRAMRTSDPSVYAIGDCARRPLVHYGDRLARLESVHNAIEGAKIAAAGILDAPPPSEEAPWFWSDQYDVKLLIAGMFQGHDRCVLRGAPEDGAFSAFYYQGARLIAVDAINRPGDQLLGKQLIQRRLTLPPATITDLGLSPKELLAAASPIR